MLDGIARRSRSGATQRPFSRCSAPSSMSIEIISSTNSGLPSAAAWMRANASASTAPPPSRPSTSCSDSCRRAARGRSPSRCACRHPRPGRASRSSGRAMATSRIGASRDQSAMCSTRSSSVGSAQLRSSKTTTSGRSPRDRLEQVAYAPEALLGGARPSRRGPTSSATRAATSSALGLAGEHRLDLLPAPPPVSRRRRSRSAA